MSIELKSGLDANKLAVNTDNEAKVALSKVVDKAGYAVIVSESDSGSITGEPLRKSPEISSDYRFRTGVDTVIDTESFNYTAQNTAKHIYRNTTMTNAWSGGFMSTNSGSITTITTGSIFQSYRTYPLFGAAATYFECNMSFTNWLVANTIIDFGAFLAATSNPFAPSDGVYFRVTSAGLIGIINYNGTEVQTGTFDFSPTFNKSYKFTISVDERHVEFWIDDVLVGSLDTSPGNGQPCASSALPFSVRHAIVGGAASAVISAKLSDYTISLGDYQTSKQWSHQASGMNMHAYQGLSGGTMGSSANYANSANPTAAVPSNTTAALGSGLGGQFWETDTLSVNTDGIIQSFQNPAGGPTVTPRNLYIDSITINSFVQTALTGGGYVAQWSLAFGHNAVSLATGEAATTKAPRRVALGMQAVASGAVAGTVLTPITINFPTPILVQPGEFIQSVRKKIGTAPSAGVIGHTITFSGYYE